MLFDHIAKLALSDEVASQKTNEIGSLDYLREGLRYLNAQVQSVEQRISEQAGTARQIAFIGKPPGFEWTPQGLIACAFHWYATSACNYVRLVGWLLNEGDPKRTELYVESVIPQVLTWRNKVGAHFAQTAPRKDDSAAVLAASVMFPIGFESDRFVTMPFMLVMTKGGSKSASGPEMHWSLTTTHEELTQRYWPQSR